MQRGNARKPLPVQPARGDLSRGTTMSDQHIPVNEAALRLGVTPRTIRLWVTSGKLAGERVRGRFGPEWRIAASDVDRLLEAESSSALVVDPAGKPGGNEFRAALSLLYQEHAALEARTAEDIAHVAGALARLEALTPALERLEGEFAESRAQSQALHRAVADTQHQQQRYGQDVRVALQGISALLQEQRDLLASLGERLAILEARSVPWWRRWFGASSRPRD